MGRVSGGDVVGGRLLFVAGGDVPNSQKAMITRTSGSRMVV